MPKSSPKKMLAAVVISISMMLSNQAFAANVTSTANVNVRSGPGTSYRILTVMSKGTKGNSISSSNGWTKIAVKGVTGYVSSQYLSNSSNGSASTKVVYITASSLNVRSGAGTSYSVIGSLPKGKAVTVIGTSGNWYKIKYGYSYGYISRSYTSSTSSTAHVSPTTNSSPKNTTMYCTASVLNVRSGAGNTYSVIGTLRKGKSATVVSTSNGWSKIKYGKGYGYVSSSYLSSSQHKPATAVPTSTSSTKTMYCTASVLNVRSGAGTTYSAIGTLRKGKSAAVVSSSNGWSKIKYGRGYGYVSSKYLSSSKPQLTTSKQPTDASGLVSYAKQFLGCKYVWGASGPNTFDCSGFTQYVYKHFGVSIPRVSKDQYSQSKKIGKSQLRIGDLVFFSNNTSNGKIAHVGIYIGNKQMIHAANPRDNLCISNLSESYYAKHYVGCGRYL